MNILSVSVHSENIERQSAGTLALHPPARLVADRNGLGEMTTARHTTNSGFLAGLAQ
jgi:hypothetical protein